MAARKTAEQWFAEYGAYHRNRANVLLQGVCVPVLFASVLGLLWAIPVPGWIGGQLPGFRWSLPAIALALVFYVRLSPSLTLGLLAFILACHGVIHLVAARAPWPVWAVGMAAFAAARLGQFAGWQIEGRKPTLRQDLQFLLIGPAWLLAKVYRKLGLPD